MHTLISAPCELEAEVRQYLLDLMPLEYAPAHLRLAFHDAGTYDQRTNTGGAHGTVRLLEQLHRSENTGWAAACLELLAEAKEQYPSVSWADLIALAGAAAVQKSGGPVIQVGLGRTDGDQPAPTGRLPGGYEGAALLKSTFARMGLSSRDLVALSGAHTLGHSARRPFTAEPLVFSNAYFVQLLETRHEALLQTDRALLRDPELRQLIELYAADEKRFRTDFVEAFYRLTWLGNEPRAA
jgi:L-ascorbate peroxidase